jgi:hypothetical protein
VVDRRIPCQPDLSIMIALDSPQWAQLRHAYGAAADTAVAIQRLIDRPTGPAADAIWHDLFGSLVHQGTVYQAALAAVPHLVRIATRLPPEDRLAFIDFIGLVATNVVVADPADPLWRGCAAAFAAADALVDPQLAAEDDHDVLIAAGARAAFAGCQGIARIVRDRAYGMTFEPNCPVDDCGVTIAIDFDGARGIAEVDEDSTVLAPIEPTVFATAAWSETDALARLVAQLTGAGRTRAAATLAALDSLVICPHCDTAFALVPTLLDPNEL